MKLQKYCYGCLSDFARKIIGLATGDEKLRNIAEERAEALLEKEFSIDQVSVGISARIFHLIREITGNHDPYSEVKKMEIEIGREAFAELAPKYDGNLPDLLKLAVTGNSLDFFKPIESVRKDMHKKVTFAIEQSENLAAMIKRSKKILYLADNAGETFFDIPLLRLMRQTAEVTYVIKPSPIQNDVTIDDIKYAGLVGEVGTVMDTGCPTAGIVFEQASDGFIRKYKEADLIFAKGMGYYETLSEIRSERRVFYCFKAKCRPVAESLGVPLDSYIAMMK